MESTIKFTDSSTMTWDLYQTMNRELRGRGMRRASVFLGMIVLFIGDILLCMRLRGPGFFFLAMGLLFPFIMRLALNRNMRREYESGRISQGRQTTFRFYEEYFETENENTHSRIAYEELYRVVEGKDNFYLLLSANQSFAVPKNSEDLTQFLRKYAAPEENGATGETILFVLGIVFAVCLTVFSIIYGMRPNRDLLRNWVHVLFYGSMVLAEGIVILRSCLMNMYSIPKIRKTGRRIAAHIASVAAGIVLIVIIAAIAVFNFFGTGTITKNADGTYTYADMSYTTQYYIYESDGPFYLRYVRPAEQSERDETNPAPAQTEQQATETEAAVQYDTEYQQIDDGYRKIYDTYLTSMSDGAYEEQYNAKGNSYIVIAEDSSMLRYLMYDRDSQNGNCALYVLYEVQKDSAGNYSLSDAAILDMYAYEYSTGNTADSGKKDWADTGSEEYRNLTGE